MDGCADSWVCLKMVDCLFSSCSPLPISDYHIISHATNYHVYLCLLLLYSFRRLQLRALLYLRLGPPSYRLSSPTWASSSRLSSPDRPSSSLGVVFHQGFFFVSGFFFVCGSFSSSSSSSSRTSDFSFLSPSPSRRSFSGMYVCLL